MYREYLRALEKTSVLIVIHNPSLVILSTLVILNFVNSYSIK